MSLASHPNPEGGPAGPDPGEDVIALRRGLAFVPDVGRPGPRVVRSSYAGGAESYAHRADARLVAEDVDYLAPTDVDPKQRASVLAKLGAAWAAGALAGWEDGFDAGRADAFEDEDLHQDCGPDEGEQAASEILADAVEVLHHLAHGEEPVTLCLSAPCKGARPQLDERAAHRYRGAVIPDARPVETVPVAEGVL